MVDKTFDEFKINNALEMMLNAWNLTNTSLSLPYMLPWIFPLYQNILSLSHSYTALILAFSLSQFPRFSVTLTCTVMPHLTRISLEQSSTSFSRILRIKNFLLQDLVSLFSIVCLYHFLTNTQSQTESTSYFRLGSSLKTVWFTLTYWQIFNEISYDLLCLCVSTCRDIRHRN